MVTLRLCMSIIDKQIYLVDITATTVVIEGYFFISFSMFFYLTNFTGKSLTLDVRAYSYYVIDTRFLPMIVNQ